MLAVTADQPASAEEQPRGLTTGAAATALRVGHQTLLDWARSGIVKPAYRTAGGHMRWDLDDLQRQVDEHLTSGDDRT